MLDITITDDPFTVNVLVAGPSGAGKTVYLASMFKFLGTQGKEIGMYLSADQEARVLLADVYRRVADPKVEWPQSTLSTDSREYELNCQTKFKGKSHSILQVKYFDYAGELLTDNTDDNCASKARKEIEKRAREAQSVLCFLGGRRLARFIQGEEDGLQHFHVHMSPVFSLLQEVEKPIHFVITKWDLLCDLEKNEASSLQLVRDKLLEIRDSRNLKDNTALPHNGEAPAILLIPVGAVGPEYVRPLPDGQMKKISGRVPQPQYVEMPFLAIFPDLFSSVLGKLDVETQRMLIRQIRIATRMTTHECARWLAGILGDKMSKVIVGAVKTVVGGKSIDKVSAAAVDTLTSSSQGTWRLQAHHSREGAGSDRPTDRGGGDSAPDCPGPDDCQTEGGSRRRCRRRCFERAMKQVNAAGEATVTTVHHPDIGHLTLIYRISHIATAECEDGTPPAPQDRPLVAEDLLRDDHGRPIELAYGLIYRSKPDRVPEHGAELLAAARIKAIIAYRDFLHDEASETKLFQQPPPEQEVTHGSAQPVPTDESTPAEDPLHPTFGDVKETFTKAWRTFLAWLRSPQEGNRDSHRNGTM